MLLRTDAVRILGFQVAKKNSLVKWYFVYKSPLTTTNTQMITIKKKYWFFISYCNVICGIYQI